MTKLLTPTEVVQALMDGKDVEELTPDGNKWYKVKCLGALSVSALINPDYKFRLVQEMITVGDVSFPKPESRAPEIGGMYYMPCFNAQTFCAQYHWDGGESDQRFLKGGLVHLSRENAIAHTKALIKLSGGECE